jgi:hypothetical protein
MSDASEHATFACSPFHGWTIRWPGTCRAGQGRGKANASGAFRRRRGAPLSGRLDQSGLRLRPSATSWQEGEQDSVADLLRSFRLTRSDPEGRSFVGRADGTGRLLRSTARSLAPRPRPGRARRVARRTPPSPRRPDKIAAQSTPSFLAGGAAHAFGLSSGWLPKGQATKFEGWWTTLTPLYLPSSPPSKLAPPQCPPPPLRSSLSPRSRKSALP